MVSRVPPQNLEAEQSVLGGLMLDTEAWDNVADLINEEDFYKASHRKIFASIKELNLKSLPADIITVSNLLKDKEELEVVGGAAYIAEIINQTPSAANIAVYAKIIKEKSLLRRLIQVSGEVTEKAYKAEYEDFNSFLDGVEAEVFAIAEKKQTTGLVPTKDLVRTSITMIEELYNKKQGTTGVPTGYIDLDKMTAGFQPGDLIILAARPSMGKTALSLNIATHAAIREKKTVAYFSLEMSKEQLMMRMLASEAKVSVSDIRTGRVQDRAWPQLIQAASVLSEANFYIDDASSISPFEIKSKARRLKATKGLDIVFIDYLQIMELKQKVENRALEISQISKTLKAIAKELKIPIVALAQLNRAVEGRSERQPVLSDLRESGSIEQDADLICMIYREDYYEKDGDNKGIAEILIRKQRNGPTGSVRLKWFSEFGRFENLEMGLPPPDLEPSKPSGSSPGVVRRSTPPSAGVSGLPNMVPPVEPST